MLVNTVSIKN